MPTNAETLAKIAEFAKIKMQDGDLDEINVSLSVIDEIDNIRLTKDEFSRDFIEHGRNLAKPSPPLRREELLGVAPSTEAACFSVPKILGGEN